MAVDTDIRGLLLQIALEATEQGPGFAQESHVLHEAGRRLGVRGDIVQQQRILTAWHNLFATGDLAWGYDLDNPSSPFFHKPQ
jgi:hypothetical protein